MGLRADAWPGDQGDTEGVTDDLYERVQWARRRSFDELGIYITWVSGKRSNQEQVALRIQNCAANPARPTQWEIYSKPSGACNPPTAIPGTSKHERGEAGDLRPGPRDFPEVRAIFYEAGLTDPVAREGWHWEVKLGAGPLPEDPTPITPPPPEEDTLSIPNDSLIRHRDGREFIVNGVTKIATPTPKGPDGNTLEGGVQWLMGCYNFARALNPSAPILEDLRADVDSGTALVDFRGVNIDSYG